MRLGKRNHDEPASALENIRILKRRIEWLDRRIKQAKKEYRTAHFDISERDALKWVIDELGHWVDLTDDEDELEDF